MMTLMADAAQVIEIRLRMMVQGSATAEEMLLMITEKIEAAQHAARTLVGGGSASVVVDNYRKIVSANVDRLSRR